MNRCTSRLHDNCAPIQDDEKRLDLYRVASGRTKAKRLVPDVKAFCPNVDGSRLLFVQDDDALYSSRVGLFRTVSKRLCVSVSTAYIKVTADDVFYFFRTVGTLCRSDNGDEYRAVSDKVEAVAVEGHLALFAVRGEDGKLHVYANYKNRRRDTEIAGGIAALAA